MKRYICIIFILFLCQSIMAQDTLNLTTKTGTISGTLLLPKNLEKKVPVVLLIAGSGPTDRDGNQGSMKTEMLKMIAESFAQNEIASLRYDKRGIGASKNAGIDTKDLRLQHFIEDAKGWVDLLKKDQRFSTVVVAGHSLGSLIGMVTVRDMGADKFISLAGSGRRFDILLREQFEQQPEFVKGEANKILDSLSQGHQVKEVSPFLNAVFNPNMQPYLLSMFEYDPQEVIKTLEVPILIVQGTTDLQVKQKDAKLLAVANPKAQLNVIEEMNHVLKRAKEARLENLATYNKPELPLIEGLMPALITFVLE